jgi:hypothetical protein
MFRIGEVASTGQVYADIKASMDQLQKSGRVGFLPFKAVSDDKLLPSLEDIQKCREANAANTNLKPEVRKSRDKYYAAFLEYVNAENENSPNLLEARAKLKQATDGFLSDGGLTFKKASNEEKKILDKYSKVKFVGCTRLLNGKMAAPEKFCKDVGMSDEDTKRYLYLLKQEEQIIGKTELGRYATANQLF